MSSFRVEVREEALARVVVVVELVIAAAAVVV